jgi:hypothetical protein
MLLECDGEILSSWLLFPDTNGTILLQYAGGDKDASISIGKTAFSYFVDDGKQNVEESACVDFSPSGIIKTISHINQQQ